MKNPEIAKFFYEIANILEMQDVQFKPEGKYYKRMKRMGF